MAGGWEQTGKVVGSGDNEWEHNDTEPSAFGGSAPIAAVGGGW